MYTTEIPAHQNICHLESHSDDAVRFLELPSDVDIRYEIFIEVQPSGVKSDTKQLYNITGCIN